MRSGMRSGGGPMLRAWNGAGANTSAAIIATGLAGNTRASRPISITIRDVRGAPSRSPQVHETLARTGDFDGVAESRHSQRHGPAPQQQHDLFTVVDGAAAPPHVGSAEKCHATTLNNAKTARICTQV